MSETGDGSAARGKSDGANPQANPRTSPPVALEPSQFTDGRTPTWRWTVCGLLLLATMILYMDRQTLSLTVSRINSELKTTEAHYGLLETGFSWAFALGAILSGFLADRLSVRWMYPAVLLGWSMAGFATAYSPEIGQWLAPFLFPRFGTEQSWLGDDQLAGRSFLGLMVCRIVLGFFESGHWPCALVTTQRILERKDRSFGNSLLQSGASIGAVITPQVVRLLMTDEPGSWKSPYVVTGIVGALWVIPWMLIVRRTDLARPADASPEDLANERATATTQPQQLIPRIAALAVVVIAINLTWQFFRAWLPLFLEKQHHYSGDFVKNFVTAYYIMTDVGCICVGAAVKGLAARGLDVHRARMFTFFGCAVLTGCAALLPKLPAGPMLLVVLMLLAFGSLGLFPNYYAFTQEISKRHQGKVSGILASVTWFVTGYMQKVFGKVISETQSYAFGITVAGLAPLFGFLAMLFLWNLVPRRNDSSKPIND